MFAPYFYAMEYIIGAGAILETGESGAITPATLHADVGAPLAESVRAAAIDFEGTAEASLQRLLILTQGSNAAAFRSAVSEPLRAQRVCTLADVLSALAAASGCGQVHLFAHWLPSEETCKALAARGIELVCHPLESVRAAALVSGQRCRRFAA